jgi:outer membrane protein TolC
MRTLAIIPALALIGLPCLLRADDAPAAAPLSLGQAQSQAAELNPSLKKLDAQARAAEAKPAADLAAYLPHVGLDAQHLLDARYGDMEVVFGGVITFPAAFPQDTLTLDARWTLFDGLRGWRQRQGDVAEAQAARLELSHAAFRLRQEVAMRFYKALAAQQLADVAQQNVATLEEHLRLAQATEDSGSATPFDVLRVSAQHEEAVAGALQAQDQAGLARLDLGQAMGLSADARSLDGSLPVPRAGDVADGLAPDLASRQDLQALALRREAQDRRAQATLASWAPQLYLFAERQYYHYGEFNPLILPTNDASGRMSFGDMYMEGVGLSWDLFNGGADLSRRAEAVAQAQAAEQGLAAAQLAAGREFDSWKRRFHDSTRLYEARLRVLEECQESVRLAQLGLKAGTRTNSELLDAELDLFRARAGLVQAQSDAAEAKLSIELLQGGARP